MIHKLQEQNIVYTIVRDYLNIKQTKTTQEQAREIISVVIATKADIDKAKCQYENKVVQYLHVLYISISHEKTQNEVWLTVSS